MHGYEMIQEIAERSNDLWKPSPGSVYPTLQLLEDEGLIVAGEHEGSKKLYELTDEGKTAAEAIETAPWTEIAEGADPAQMNLRNAVGQLFGAVRQAAFAASTEQQQRIVDIVNNARREIYQILGEN
jgi:DNA-binding PadR family transcriptional regulator